MNLRYFLYPVCLSIALSLGTNAFAARSTKPLPPVRISIVPTQPGVTSDFIGPGDVVEFRIAAVSLVPAEELSISVDLLGGTKLIAGDLSWKGPVNRGEEKSFTLSVRAPENGRGRIRARVSLSDGARFSNQAQYRLGPEPRKMKPQNEHPVRKDSRGRDVIEYR